MTYDGATNRIRSLVDGVLVDDATTLGQVDYALFKQTASATVANTTTETAITSTGVGSLTLPANFFVAGKTLRITAYGYHSATANPNITVKIKFGSTVILTTGAVTSGNSTDEIIQIMAMITCRTTGATGTIQSEGFYLEGASGASGKHFGMVNTSTTTIDTTATQAITVTVQWGTANASNTITAANLVVEQM